MLVSFGLAATLLLLSDAQFVTTVRIGSAFGCIISGFVIVFGTGR